MSTIRLLRPSGPWNSWIRRTRGADPPWKLSWPRWANRAICCFVPGFPRGSGALPASSLLRAHQNSLSVCLGFLHFGLNHKLFFLQMAGIGKLPNCHSERHSVPTASVTLVLCGLCAHVCCSDPARPMDSEGDSLTFKESELCRLLCVLENLHPHRPYYIHMCINNCS